MKNFNRKTKQTETVTYPDIVTGMNKHIIVEIDHLDCMIDRYRIYAWK